MEQKSLSELNKNAKNPRRISEHDFAALQTSIQEFGDLSGVVYNEQTQQLVGGHQRKEAFMRLGGQASVVITERLAEPDDVGTVAYGHILWNGKKYGYRAVSWDPNRELAANIAANRIQGEWDLDLLAEADYKLFGESPDLLALTGQRDDEIAKLLQDSGAVDTGEAVAASEPPRSQFGVTYALGSHRLVAGTSQEMGGIVDAIGGLQYIDDARKLYARTIGRENEWELATPAIAGQPVGAESQQPVAVAQ